MKGQTAVTFPGNRRLHIGLTVSDLQRSRQFYETLLGVPPAKERPGYVKFEPTDPSVNLTLNAAAQVADGGNHGTHYGVQVKSTQAVQEAVERLASAGLQTKVQENTSCCYSVQDKVWVADPDGNQWEVFVVLHADTDLRKDEQSNCCAGDAAGPSTGACC